MAQPHGSQRIATQFLDLQATVEDGEEQSDDDDVEDEDIAAFIASDEEDQPDHPRPSRLPVEDFDDSEGLHGLAASLEERYRTTRGSLPPECSIVLLEPTMQDPDLWMVRTRQGAELATVFKIMQQQLPNEVPAVLSAFAVPARLPSRIFVESPSHDVLSRACSQITTIRFSKGFILIPVEERSNLLRVYSEDRRIMPQSWVRLRRGPNKGDLAYVLNSDANCDQVRIAVVPRIPLSMPVASLQDGRKRKHESTRPSAQLFNLVRLQQVYGKSSVSSSGDGYQFNKQKYRNGLLEIDVFSTQTLLRVLCPTLAEVRPFVEAGLITSEAALALSSREVNGRLRPGDSVELIRGEQSGCTALVVSCHEDTALLDLDPVDIRQNIVDRIPSFLEVQLKYLRPVFRIGDNVRVVVRNGESEGSSGCVVSIQDGGRCLTFLDDKTKTMACILLKFMQVDLMPCQIDVLSVSVESYLPDFVHSQAAATNPPLSKGYAVNPLAGRRVLVVGRNRYKGYVGYVQSLTDTLARIELDANHFVVPVQKKNVIDFFTGRTLAGDELFPQWRQDFTIALRKYVQGVQQAPPRSITPLPSRESSPVPSPSGGSSELPSAWRVTAEDLGDRPYNGPEKWLLDYWVDGLRYSCHLVVQFKSEYDGGRWAGRTAKTPKPWNITDTHGQSEIALIWTGNKAEPRSADVHVAYLNPARPIINGQAVIIKGDQAGKVVSVLRRKRGKSTDADAKRVIVRADGLDWEVVENELCRVEKFDE